MGETRPQAFTLMNMFLLLIVFASLALVNASNNWKIPCLNGECWYDIPSRTPGAFGGTLVIVSSSSAPVNGSEMILVV